MSGNPPDEMQTRARQRLARISHHFLSEPQPNTNATNPGNKPGSHFFVVADNHTQPFPTIPLAIQLARNGLNCEIHHPGLTSVNIRPQAPAQSNTNAGLSNRHIKHISAQIHARHNIDAIPGGTPYTLLLPTEASQQGLRHSFILLKQHLTHTPALHTGITITGTNDPALARSCFSALQQACQRFINPAISLSLRSYGLLDHSTDYHASPELAGIARLIIEDCIERSDPRHAHVAESFNMPAT
jgi:hypothetical protein